MILLQRWAQNINVSVWGVYVGCKILTTPSPLHHFTTYQMTIESNVECPTYFVGRIQRERCVSCELSMLVCVDAARLYTKADAIDAVRHCKTRLERVTRLNRLIRRSTHTSLTPCRQRKRRRSLIWIRSM